MFTDRLTYTERKMSTARNAHKLKKRRVVHGRAAHHKVAYIIRRGVETGPRKGDKVAAFGAVIRGCI